MVSKRKSYRKLMSKKKIAEIKDPPENKAKHKTSWQQREKPQVV